MSGSVSYTHLVVYKRQNFEGTVRPFAPGVAKAPTVVDAAFVFPALVAVPVPAA